MSNPFKQIKQEAYLTQDEKNAMRAKLVFEMSRTVETDLSPSSAVVPSWQSEDGLKPVSTQRPIPELVEGSVKSPFAIPSKYFFSGIAVLAAVVFVVTNLQKQTMLTPSVMMEHQVASDSSFALKDGLVSKKVEPESSSKNTIQNIETNTVTMNQSSMSGSLFTVGSSNSSTASAPSARSFETSATTASFTAGTSAMSSFGPRLIIKLKPGNEFLINYVPICYNNGKLTCYPGKNDLHRATHLSGSYYFMVSPGNSFSLITYSEASKMEDDSALADAFSKGIKMSFRDAIVAGYECSQVAQTVEELKAIAVSGSVEKCQKLW